jgi:hypothetical protein
MSTPQGAGSNTGPKGAGSSVGPKVVVLSSSSSGSEGDIPPCVDGGLNPSDHIHQLQVMLHRIKRNSARWERLYKKAKSRLVPKYQQSTSHKLLVREWGRAYARAAVLAAMSQINPAEATMIDLSKAVDEADREIGSLVHRDVISGVDELGGEYSPMVPLDYDSSDKESLEGSDNSGGSY